VGGLAQLLKQAEAVLITLVWSGVISFILLKLIDATIGLRVTRDQEMEGLDIVLHGETIG
jgi:Amt family ammonium transporter